jgi:ECF transporter S component (folate family)
MQQNTLKISLFNLISLAILIALGLVLGLLTVGTNVWQVSLTFLANTLMGAVGGPLWAGLAMAVSDVIHALFMSHYGYFPGFTFSALIVGVIYGLFFFRKSLDIRRWQDWLYTLIAVIVIMLVDTVFFNSLWVSMLYKMPFKVAVVARLPLLIQVPARTIVIMLVLPALQRIPQLRKALNIKARD